MLVQPLVGVVSDRTGMARKNVLLLGAFASSVSLIGLALADPFAAAFASIFSAQATDHQWLFEVLAFAWVWALSISVQPLQAASRALVVESCPDHQQVQAAAWMGKAVAGSSVLGYSLGVLPFTESPLLRGWRTFQFLCVITAVALVPLALVTCCFSSPTAAHVVANRHLDRKSSGPRALTTAIIHEFKRTSYVVRRVFYVQFLSWLCWFPVMYFQTQ